MFHCNLRPFSYQDDLIQLYQYMSNEKNQILFSHKFHTNDISMFEHWLREKFHTLYHDFFIIEDIGTPIGFTYSYDYYPYDGHCKLTLCLYDPIKHKGYGAAATIKMMDYLFKFYPLNQIFISVFDYNQTSLHINQKAGFEEVGCLPNYRYYNGQYYSLHYLTLKREQFYEKYKKYI